RRSSDLHQVFLVVPGDFRGQRGPTARSRAPAAARPSGIRHVQLGVDVVVLHLVATGEVRADLVHDWDPQPPLGLLRTDYLDVHLVRPTVAVAVHRGGDEQVFPDDLLRIENRLRFAIFEHRLLRWLRGGRKRAGRQHQRSSQQTHTKAPHAGSREAERTDTSTFTAACGEVNCFPGGFTPIALPARDYPANVLNRPSRWSWSG